MCCVAEQYEADIALWFVNLSEAEKQRTNECFLGFEPNANDRVKAASPATAWRLLHQLRLTVKTKTAAMIRSEGKYFIDANGQALGGPMRYGIATGSCTDPDSPFRGQPLVFKLFDSRKRCEAEYKLLRSLHAPRTCEFLINVAGEPIDLSGM